LCEGWTVHDVAAHLAGVNQIKMSEVVVALVKSRFTFARANRVMVARQAARPSQDIVSDLRRLADGRFAPPGLGSVAPLTDVLVHGQDIAVPLGLEREMPVAAAAFAARRVWTAIFPFFPQRRLTGLQLVADDSDLRVGRGAPVHGRTQDLLLLLTGRYARVDRLSGEGSAVLAERVRV
jgi:uncharacterized protein (TIGR03083 family)